jgi:HYR domain
MKPIKQFLVPLLMIFMVILGISPHTMGQGSEIITTPGINSWTQPPGVTTFTVKIWGAGGGGGNFAGTNGQGGGGGGAFHKVTVTTSPTALYTWTNAIVGAGGTAGNAGGTSSFGIALVSAAGGSGSNIGDGFGGLGGIQAPFPLGLNGVVIVNASSASNGGDGGASTNPLQTSFGGGGGGRADDGVNGGDGTNGGTSGSGAPGAGGLVGGGIGGTTGGVGGNAASYGGGGGGRGFNGANSGTGGNGRIEITWPCPVLTSLTYPNASVVCSYGSALSATVLPVTAIGGGYTSVGNTLAGFLNPSTGSIATGAPQGTHIIKYGWAAFGGCPADSVQFTLTIAPRAVATSLTYGTPLCNIATAGTVSPGWGALSGVAGVYTIAPVSGLSIDASTGVITPSGATAGSYVVTYTVAASGNCNAVTATSNTIVVTATPTISNFDYPPAGTPNKYCAGAGIQFPTSTVTNPNNNTISYSYTTSPGLSLNTSTGAINPATSTPGVYVVTMTIALGGGCAAVSATSTVEILARPTATFEYTGSPYCQTVFSTSQVVNITATTGGPFTSPNFTATPSGLTINATTGTINLNSAPGTYIVKYRFVGVNGCLDSATAMVKIKPRPTSTISYAGLALICSNISPIVSGNVVAQGAWTLTLSNGQTTTGTGSGPWSITINTMNPGDLFTLFNVSALVDTNNCPAAVIDRPGSVVISKRTITSGTIDGASNVKVCEGQAASINVVLTSGANCAPLPRFSGVFAIEYWDGAVWVPHPTNPIYAWTSPAGASTSGTSAAISIPANILNNPNSYTLQYRISWVSLVDCNGCAADPLDGSVVVEVVPNPLLNVTAAPVGNVCPGTTVSFTVTQLANSYVLPQHALFNWVATRPNGSIIAQGQNTALGTISFATPPCPFNDSVTVRFTPLNTSCCNCLYTPIIRKFAVRDTTAPVWNTPTGDLNRRLQCSDVAGLTAAQLLFPVASDNCDTDVTNIVKTTGLFVAGNCPQAGTYTNTWKVTDECGNISAMFTQVITIIDSIAPTWDDLAGSLNRRLQCSDTAGLRLAQLLAPVARDNCDGQLTASQYTKNSGLFVAGSCPQAGTYTNTWTVKDDCDNVSLVFTQIITIVDTIAPMWTSTVGSLNRRLQCSDVQGLADAQALVPVAIDNCDGQLTASQYTKLPGLFVVGSCPQAGTYTNTFTVKDDCNNVSTVFTQVITIIDSIAPTWDNLAGSLNRRLQCSDSAGLRQAQLLAPIARDNCDATLSPSQYTKISGLFVPGSCPQAGTYTNTWTVKDDCNNTSLVFTQVITIIDTIAPMWNTTIGSLDRRLQCSDAAGIALAQALKPVAMDNCDGSVTNLILTDSIVVVPSPVCPQTRTITKRWTVTDDCGNTSVKYTQVITIIDSIAPVLITAGTFPTGSTGLGINGCIGSAPVAPLDAVIQALYRDNCGTVSVTHTGAPTGNACAWTVTYVYTITDNCGNTVTPAPSVTYYGSDRTAPVFAGIIPTQILNVGAFANCLTTIPNYVDSFNIRMTTTDCSKITYAQLAPNTPGTSVSGWGGYRDIVIEATDSCGNKSQTTFRLELKDLTAPNAICRPFTLVLNANGTGTITTANINNGSNDNCAGTDLTYSLSKTNFNCTNVGANTVTLSVTDQCQNTSTCTAIVTVVDNTAPVITCFGDTTVNKDANCTYTMPDMTFRVTATDACGIDTVTQSIPLGHVFAASQTFTNVTLTVIDVNGNQSTCTFKVNFKDVTPPVITGCPANITVYTGIDRTTCNQVATWIPPVATDACTPCCQPGTPQQTITGNFAPGATFPVGVTTVTYTATDLSGNTSTCVFTVTVIDNTAPVVAGCPANVSVNTGAGRPTCDQVATWTEPTATDNCTATANLVRYRSHAPGTTFPVGVTNVKYAFKDAAGNTSDTCRFTVTVIDNTVPTITCPGNIVNPPINTAGCLANVVTTNPTLNDNCGVTKLTWALTGVTTGASAATGINYLGTRTFNFGVTTVTYTVSDAAGNTATCSYTVSVTRPFTAAISGTSTVLQNNTGTSNVLFTSQLGTAPYTIVYSTTAGGFPGVGTHTIVTNSNPVGGNSSIISSNPNWLVTTVPQSSAMPGTYTYTLISVTDAYGCVVTPNTTAVVTVIAASYPAPDLTPNIANNGSLFLAPTNTKTGILEIFNSPNVPGTNATSGMVSFDVFSPSNFTLNIANATTTIGSTAVQNSQFDIVYYAGIGYAIQTKPGVVIPANTSLKVGYTITATAGANNQGQFIVNIANQTGGIITAVGDNNDTNNNTLKTFKIIN